MRRWNDGLFGIFWVVQSVDHVQPMTPSKKAFLDSLIFAQETRENGVYKSILFIK